MRDMGGNEKKILVIANVPSYQGSDKTLCNESGKKNGNMPTSAVPPPIPMSPIVEKMEGLKAIRNRSNSLRFGRLAFYRHLEKVGTMRCFWELKHIELEGGNQQGKDAKDKGKLNLKSLKAQMKKWSLETSDSLPAPVLPEQGSAKEIGEDAEEGPEEDAKFEEHENDDKAEVSFITDISAKTDTSSVLKQESKRRVTEEDLVKDDLKKSRVEDIQEKKADELVLGENKPQHINSDAVKTEVEEERNESDVKEFFIDSSPPPSAPFEHRIVTPKPHQIAAYYSINREEVLGGGRFGQVHKCVENSSGLTLAAKIIRAKSQKEKDVVRNEIQVMNQLNHSNLIQLYAAFESRHDIILVMEYVEGGELFDRIIDENYNLTEFDTVLFIHQICEGLQYMHKMYILHLDLKPENILCVSRATNKIKIIDFGLARRYKPREKLKVNFGTPEFLAPEVINYEFVSFPTDMWSLGVITYMLLSGLSPFLGDDDNETLNNILACQWNFEEEEFTDVSDEAKDFITRLLVKSKSWRMSAAESLRHPWLSDRSLHYNLHLKKNKCHSTRAPSPEC
ncbi:myosin light chain kinase family member 4 isoform X2 [Dunckerocampus dactyliophorus]|uniref:myosin light chain kinase family member 4 isoform X2 n=1 Tax=Dunckerocampus dactyliophorus TaxID=161453 RepID=UPI0024062DF0|nr:myosin light chain kinase family member 4 isoform X2 [Dunckerocampus dactyliophorus]